jgi:hypothetical protein
MRKANVTKWLLFFEMAGLGVLGIGVRINACKGLSSATWIQGHSCYPISLKRLFEWNLGEKRLKFGFSYKGDILLPILVLEL